MGWEDGLEGEQGGWAGRMVCKDGLGGWAGREYGLGGWSERMG